MKLFEIKPHEGEFPFDTITAKANRNVDFSRKGTSNIEVLGQGYEAIAYREHGSPNVIKVVGSNEGIKELPYVQYILLLKKYAAENPHFPRVYQASVKQMVPDNTPDEEDEDIHPSTPIPMKFAYVFKMEPLIPLDHLSDDELHALWRTTFASEPDSGIKEYHFSDKFYDMRVDPEEKIRIRKENPRLFKAVELIKKIAEKLNATVDIHQQNVMVRRTSAGLQLVITDPLVKFR